MAIFKSVKAGKGAKGAKAAPSAPVRIADFSYHPNDSLAQMIVDAWLDDHYRDLLLDPGNAKSLLAAKGFFLQRPVVITEDRYYQNYTQQYDNEITFVLPQKPGDCPAGQSLLETARLLMACTPHGI